MLRERLFGCPRRSAKFRSLARPNRAPRAGSEGPRARFSGMEAQSMHASADCSPPSAGRRREESMGRGSGADCAERCRRCSDFANSTRGPETRTKRGCGCAYLVSRLPRRAAPKRSAFTWRPARAHTASIRGDTGGCRSRRRGSGRLISPRMSRSSRGTRSSSWSSSSTSGSKSRPWPNARSRGCTVERTPGQSPPTCTSSPLRAGSHAGFMTATGSPSRRGSASAGASASCSCKRSDSRCNGGMMPAHTPDRPCPRSHRRTPSQTRGGSSHKLGRPHDGLAQSVHRSADSARGSARWQTR